MIRTICGCAIVLLHWRSYLGSSRFTVTWVGVTALLWVSRCFRGVLTPSGLPAIGAKLEVLFCALACRYRVLPARTTKIAVGLFVPVEITCLPAPGLTRMPRKAPAGLPTRKDDAGVQKTTHIAVTLCLCCRLSAYPPGACVIPLPL